MYQWIPYSHKYDCNTLLSIEAYGNNNASCQLTVPWWMWNSSYVDSCHRIFIPITMLPNNQTIKLCIVRLFVLVLCHIGGKVCSHDPILLDLIHFWWKFDSLLTCNVYGRQIDENQCSTALSRTDYVPHVWKELDSTKLDRVNRP